ncbi:MAG: tetratricopeptide repeat protein [Bryobacterales bacterium]|nr:tetratricopeptide repeat protein [Bryobacterales bacterium]
MDRISRKELKSDRFQERVGSTVEYLDEHRRQVILIGGIALAVLLVGWGAYWYSGRQKVVRQQALTQALDIQNSAVGPPSGNPLVKTFPTADARREEATKAFQQIINDHSNSEEATIARYYLGVIAAEAGKEADAAKHLQEVAEAGRNPYSSLAQFALAQLYQGQGKTTEAEKLLRALIDRPSMLVSKEQATIALAKVIAPKNPAEARKLLEPLRTERSAVSRTALTALSEIPAQ